MSPPNPIGLAACEVPDAHQEELAASAPIPNSFPEGFYDTSLIYLYAKHAARHVHEGEVYTFNFMLHLFHTN